MSEWMQLKVMREQAHSLGVELKVLRHFLIVDTLLYLWSKFVRGIIVMKHVIFLLEPIEN